MRYEIIPSTHTLSKYENKIGNPSSSQWTFYRQFLPVYAMYYTYRACGRLFERRKYIKLFGKLWGISCQKFLRRNYFSFGRDERKRAKMRVLRDFLRMHNERRFWAILNTRACAHLRVRAFLRAFFDLKLTRQILTLIMTNMEKWLSFM